MMELKAIHQVKYIVLFTDINSISIVDLDQDSDLDIIIYREIGTYFFRK